MVGARRKLDYQSRHALAWFDYVTAHRDRRRFDAEAQALMEQFEIEEAAPLRRAEEV